MLSSVHGQRQLPQLVQESSTYEELLELCWEIVSAGRDEDVAEDEDENHGEVGDGDVRC